MIHGTFISDRLCRVIEQIINAREENTEVKVSLISKEESERRKEKDKTA